VLAASVFTLPSATGDSLAKNPHDKRFYDHWDWDPYVNWCSDPNHTTCLGIQEKDINGTNYCQKPDSTTLLTNGGISSLKVHKAYCQFYPTDDCNYHIDPYREFGNWIELPLGATIRVHDNDGNSKFRKGDTEIYNLWEYTNMTANARTVHWDNKIRSYRCWVEKDQPDQPVCS
jgi:hypothetical protein